MIKQFKLFILAVFASVVTIGTLTPVVLAVDPVDSIQGGVNTAGGNGSKGAGSLKGSIKTVVDILLFLLGAVAVIVIVIGGLRYVLSSGDANQITAAKNTILYAIVGLVVALLAYAIVNWVIAQF